MWAAFEDATPIDWIDDPRPSMGIATADYDADGAVDFVTGDWNRGYTLYRNTGTAADDRNWITLRLIGGGPVNRDAIGARVLVETSDGRTLRGREQRRQSGRRQRTVAPLRAGRGYHGRPPRHPLAGRAH